MKNKGRGTVRVEKSLIDFGVVTVGFTRLVGPLPRFCLLGLWSGVSVDDLRRDFGFHLFQRLGGEAELTSSSPYRGTGKPAVL